MGFMMGYGTATEAASFQQDYKGMFGFCFVLFYLILLSQLHADTFASFTGAYPGGVVVWAILVNVFRLF